MILLGTNQHQKRSHLVVQLLLLLLLLLLMLMLMLMLFERVSTGIVVPSLLPFVLEVGRLDGREHSSTVLPPHLLQTPSAQPHDRAAS